MSKFQTTRWSLIVAARDSPSQARTALEQLCRAYRPPVLAFVRRSGYGPGDAEDLTQAFFLRFLERGWYAAADPSRGRFRTLLLVSLRNFLHDQHAQAAALKRGAGKPTDADILERIAGGESPEEAFTRAWLGTVLARAMQHLEREWVRAGKRAQFEQLAPLLVEHAEASELRDIAAAAGVRSNTIAVQAHRMRRRLRQLVRLELLQTVGSGAALEQELAELRAVLETPSTTAAAKAAP
jgi:RNA polymerase sigma-70 factor (ECF subfamily)